MLIECPECLGDQAYEETYGDEFYAIHPCQVCNGYGTVRQSDLKGLAAREASLMVCSSCYSSPCAFMAFTTSVLRVESLPARLSCRAFS